MACHFLDICDLDAESLQWILSMARHLKKQWKCGEGGCQRGLHPGKSLAVILEKPSTRTQVSFSVAMAHLGGQTLILPRSQLQLGRGEPLADTARVMSRFVDCMVLRTGDHTRLLDLATHSSVPVVNGLTDSSHPCQVMADIMTFEEHLGPIAGRVVAWVGDGNNVANSWLHAAARFAFSIHVASPEQYQPAPAVFALARGQGANVRLCADIAEAVSQADCVVTDTWVSMGDTDADQRSAAFEPYRVDQAVMRLAAPGALFMHCLPAYRGAEVTAAVIDGPQSVVFDEAENRLHVQKAILLWCLSHGKKGEEAFSAVM